MCGVKFVEKNNKMGLLNMLRLKEAVDKLVRANDVRWYGHVLRRTEEDGLMKTIIHELNGKRKQGRPRIKWREQVEGNMRRIGLRKEDAADWCSWERSCRKNRGSSNMDPATSIYWEYLNQIKIELIIIIMNNEHTV